MEKDYEKAAKVEVKRAQDKKVPENKLSIETRFYGMVGGAIGSVWTGLSFIGAVAEYSVDTTSALLFNGNKDYKFTAKNHISDWYYAGIEEGACVSEGKWREISKLGLWHEEPEEETKTEKLRREIKEIRNQHNYVSNVVSSMKEPVKAAMVGRVVEQWTSSLRCLKEKEDSKMPLWDRIKKEGEEIISKYSLIVLEEVFQEKFMHTDFMKLYMKTPRISPLDEVIKDLKVVMPKDIHWGLDMFSKEHEDNPIKAVMHIWTGWSSLTQLINFSLMLDGYYTFGTVDIDKEFIEKKIKESGHDYKTIIKYTVKFMRMVNYCIVKQCTKLNTEDRVTYRGIDASILKNVKEGEKFRIMNFQCTSSLSEISKGFSGGSLESDEKDNTFVTYQIPKGCFNAGKIKEYACPKYQNQEETLIPPYTACRMTKREGKKVFVEVAYDNKSAKFLYFSF